MPRRGCENEKRKRIRRFGRIGLTPGSAQLPETWDSHGVAYGQERPTSRRELLGLRELPDVQGHEASVNTIRGLPEQNVEKIKQI